MTTEERLLRNILSAYVAKGTLQEIVSSLQKVMDQARWHIAELDACEFVTEQGIKCSLMSVKKVHGMKCCKEHALQRKKYFI
jgi:hypothetical protein